ncbi:hypothetical protein CANCADRAFT_32108 [Tortispora caseinolytica NRRL Y-17796]|uniref:Rab-GAP TBC domain-containing protein n=1 Tax=Tortispora caseinolytica NRRL Y-17796 TaxID=767744 RepID=A0A1E4T9X2_9ASCO|nr:hypothetical protein CANCADRAFT_32108 [Tortispora caseinolytica NRRL Y-17796]
MSSSEEDDHSAHGIAESFDPPFNMPVVFKRAAADLSARHEATTDDQQSSDIPDIYGPDEGSPYPETEIEKQIQSRIKADILRSKLNYSDPFDEVHDRYGFRRQTAKISLDQYNAWWKEYRPYIQRRERKWQNLMSEVGLYHKDTTNPPTRFPPRSSKVTRYIRKGIPAAWRGNAWFWYAQGPQYLAKHPGLYDFLWKRAFANHNRDAEVIERDLHRTFPDNLLFANHNQTDDESPMISALRRVLLAYSEYMPATGYCQSLNFLAGVFLIFLDEEKAFWMLVIITQKYLPGMHDENLEGANIDQGVLMISVKDTLPTVWSKIGMGFDGFSADQVRETTDSAGATSLDDKELLTHSRASTEFIRKLPPITLSTTSWFMSGFIGTLPFESVVRIWDCFFYEGSKVFFRIALTILKLCEPELNALSDPIDVFQTVQDVPKSMVDPNYLLTSCFKRNNGFGHISEAEVRARRMYVSEIRRRSSRGQLGLNRNGNTPSDQNFQQWDNKMYKFQKRSNSPLLHGLPLRLRMHRLKLAADNHT